MKLLKTLTYLNNAFLWRCRSAVGQTQSYSSTTYVDPYKVLGISRDATKAEVRSAYLKMAKLYHPDKNPSDDTSKQKFESVQNSYRSIMQRFTKTTDEPEDNDEATYDFTLTPLAVQVHPVPTLFDSPGYKKFWIFLLCFVIILLFNPLSRIPEFHSKLIDYEETEEEEVDRLRRKINSQRKILKMRDEKLKSLNENLTGFLSK